MAEHDVHLLPDFVRFYDWSCSGNDSDVRFYAGLARQDVPSVLEVACGTGRVAIALACLGLRTVGIDFSKPMLAIARTRIEHESARTRGLISLHHADMRAFDLGERFPLVLVPNASVFHLDSPVSLLECFSCLHAHTEDGGVAVVDAVSPVLMANQALDKEILVAEGINPFTGLRTREFNRKLMIDRARQVVGVEHAYTEQHGNDEKRFAFQQEYRWIEQAEGVEAMRRAGFVETEAIGDYRGTAYSDSSPRMILKARRNRVFAGSSSR